MDESVGCVNACLWTSFDKRKCVGRNGNGANGRVLCYLFDILIFWRIFSHEKFLIFSQDNFAIFVSFSWSPLGQ